MIKDLIPADASADNQLADKAYVDGSISNVTSLFQDNTTVVNPLVNKNYVDASIRTVNSSISDIKDLISDAASESNKLTDKNYVDTSLNNIKVLIPNQANPNNQLADKAFVNSTILTNTANFRGNWTTWGSVPTDADLYPEDYNGSKTPTNNDYMVVQEASDLDPMYDGQWRFQYVGEWNVKGKSGWVPQYRIGKAFTAA